MRHDQTAGNEAFGYLIVFFIFVVLPYSLSLLVSKKRFAQRWNVGFVFSRLFAPL